MSALRQLFSKQKRDARYPQQFWLLFWGVFVNRLTVSMLWPFLTIYMYNTLGVPLATVTLLLSFRAFFSIGATSIVSDLMDRVGRKRAMIAGMIASAVVFFGMAGGSSSLWVWAMLIAAHGAVMPIFNIGVQAMVADLIPRENRAPAYALIRTISNAGIAIGPVIGGYLALVSFNLVFVVVGVVFVILALLVAVILRETMPSDDANQTTDASQRGYRFLLRDQVFISFIGLFFLMSMAYAQIWSLLPVYLDENFGFASNQYSLIITVNAAMVVFLQYFVTKFSDRFPPYPVITVGAVLYAVGLYSVAWGTLLPHFMLSMAVLTIGELLVQPTAMTLVANMAPDTMRARYLGLLSLAYPVGAGVGPVVGGVLNDMIAPVAIWYGAGVMGLASAIGFLILSHVRREKRHSLARSA